MKLIQISVLMIFFTFLSCQQNEQHEKIHGLTFKKGKYFKEGEKEPFSNSRYELISEDGRRWFYEIKNGVIHGKEVWNVNNSGFTKYKYFSNGNLKSKYNKSSLNIGYVELYYENGNKKAHKTIENNTIHGPVTTFHQNGVKASEVFSVDSYKNGKEQKWDSLGNILPSIEYYYGRTEEAIKSSVKKLIIEKQKYVFEECCNKDNNACFSNNLNKLKTENKQFLFDFNKSSGDRFLVALSLKNWLNDRQRINDKWSKIKSDAKEIKFSKIENCGEDFIEEGESIISTLVLNELDELSKKDYEDLIRPLKLKNGKSRGIMGIDFEDEPFGIIK